MSECSDNIEFVNEFQKKCEIYENFTRLLLTLHGMLGNIYTGFIRIPIV